MDKLPHRAVVNLQSVLAELSDSPRKVKSPFLVRWQEPDTVFTGNRLRFYDRPSGPVPGFPVLRSRFTQPIAVLMPIPNCLAA